MILFWQCGVCGMKNCLDLRVQLDFLRTEAVCECGSTSTVQMSRGQVTAQVKERKCSNVATIESEREEGL